MFHRELNPQRNSFFVLDSLLDNVLSKDGFDANWMRSDIQETEKGYEIIVDLPGIKKNQVEVSLEEGNQLVVEVKQEGEKEKEGKYICIERRQKRYGRRVFHLGNAIDDKKIEACLEDGVLGIQLSKKAPEQKRRLISLK